MVYLYNSASPTLSDFDKTNVSQVITLDYVNNRVSNIQTTTYNPYEVEIQSTVSYVYIGELLQEVITKLSDLPDDTYITKYTYKTNTKLIETITQTDGSIVKFEYDSNDRVERVIRGGVGDNSQRIVYYRYDNDHRLTDITQVTDPNSNAGFVSTVTYDIHGRIKQVATPHSHTGQRIVTTYDYDHDDNITSIKDGRGNETTLYFDEHGNQKTRTDAAGNIVKKEYNADNQLIVETAQAKDEAG